MKNMNSTFKSNPLPMHRDFVSKQPMGTIINKHRKVKQAQLQDFKIQGNRDMKGIKETRMLKLGDDQGIPR